MSRESTEAVEIFFVTGNKNKVREVTRMLGENATIVVRPFPVDELPEIQGEVEEITRQKCVQAIPHVKGKGPIICEDTCLCFNALKGLPGPYIKAFLEKIGHEGLNNLIAAYEDKSCYCICTFAFCEKPGDEPLLFSGITEGRVVPKRGESNFGWDPIFEEASSGKTYAEMSMEEKNIVSHRSKSLKKLVAFLEEKYKKK